MFVYFCMDGFYFWFTKLLFRSAVALVERIFVGFVAPRVPRKVTLINLVAVSVNYSQRMRIQLLKRHLM